MRNATCKELFAVGEYWNGNVDELHSYLNKVDGTLSLFDVPLHYNLFSAPIFVLNIDFIFPENVTRNNSSAKLFLLGISLFFVQFNVLSSFLMKS